MYAGRKLVYDSDSGSEAEIEVQTTRRRPALQSAAAPAANAAEKKKKKKKLPPQESIDKIWSRFSQPKFSKALAVLPFAPVAPPSSPERGNELLSAGYERAAEECRRKVRKIIQECRRVNMRYRDPGWDLVSPALLLRPPTFPRRESTCPSARCLCTFSCSCFSLTSTSGQTCRSSCAPHRVFLVPM